MRRTFWSALAALIMLPATTMPGQAGSKAISCYEKARVPAVYQTVQEQVLVQPARSYIVQKPAVYAFQTRNVLVQPEKVSYRTTPAVYGFQKRRIQTSPATVGWEYRTIKGRQILCKVKKPAVYQTVSQKVLVKPASKVAVRQPAVYSQVKEKVMVQPASRYRVNNPAVYKTVTRQVQLQPARTVWQPIRIKGCR